VRYPPETVHRPSRSSYLRGAVPAEAAVIGDYIRVFPGRAALSAVPPGRLILCGLTLHLASKHAPTDNYIG
jgi:hypothetical protein